MLRSAISIFLLIAAMLAGQLALFATHSIPLASGLAQSILAISIITCLLAGGMSWVALRCVQQHTSNLAIAVKQMVAGDALTKLQAPHADLQSLTLSLNALIDHSQAATSTAAIKAKEMEIRMKVAMAEREHAESIIYSISDAVLVTDSFDELVLANESAARTFDFDLAKVERAPVGSVLHDPKLIGLIREMRQSNSKTERRIVEHTVKGAGGGRTYKVTLSCFADRANAGATDIARPAGVVAVLHDMTKEKELAAMKNDFVSNVSHELRTPLASIKAYVEMLIDGEADDEKTKTEFYEVIQNEANRLGRLIDDILNISRIESGLVKVNKQPQSLGVIIKEAVEVIVPQATQKNITVREGSTPIYYQTLADRDMLYQAILNLLSNAVKYTPDGGSIELQTIIDESNRTVVTRITDTGVGIPPKDLPYVFEKFYRAEANNRMAKGTGLGLSLVKQIIETVHGGKMFVESTVGKGSSFGFELQLAE
jgi:two-component system phosphate regulon sensor histidine kinase PhoR